MLGYLVQHINRRLLIAADLAGASAVISPAKVRDRRGSVSGSTRPQNHRFPSGAIAGLRFPWVNAAAAETSRHDRLAIATRAGRARLIACPTGLVMTTEAAGLPSSSSPEPGYGLSCAGYNIRSP